MYKAAVGKGQTWERDKHGKGAAMGKGQPWVKEEENLLDRTPVMAMKQGGRRDFSRYFGSKRNRIWG